MLQTRKWQDKDGKDRYTTGIFGEKMQMLSGRGEGGGQGQRQGGGGRPSQQQYYNHGPSHEEASFNPDDQIQF